jgi:hypothetical protein
VQQQCSNFAGRPSRQNGWIAAAGTEKLIRRVLWCKPTLWTPPLSTCVAVLPSIIIESSLKIKGASSRRPHQYPALLAPFPKLSNMVPTHRFLHRHGASPYQRNQPIADLGPIGCVAFEFVGQGPIFQRSPEDDERGQGKGRHQPPAGAHGHGHGNEKQ